jgi:hypothetical protein
MYGRMGRALTGGRPDLFGGPGRGGGRWGHRQRDGEGTGGASPSWMGGVYICLCAKPRGLQAGYRLYLAVF